MELPKYPLKADPSLMVFEFTSTGPKGNISKIIRYDKTGINEVYHLGFGNKDEETNAIDYYHVDNNGDTEKILATVAATLYLFFDKHPGVWVYAKGSTPARNRLYRGGITRFITLIESDFEIMGLHEKKWVPFSKQLVCDAFMVKQK
ncbi:MAG: hypothetical protein JNM68_15570 [Dinghuibacter sp.]|nr:hypothetical protein [Dinghuibacter sp.]